MRDLVGFLLALLWILVWFTLAVLTVIGWVYNLFALIAAADAGDVTILVVLRIIGLCVFPVGALLGWFA